MSLLLRNARLGARMSGSSALDSVAGDTLAGDAWSGGSHPVDILIANGVIDRIGTNLASKCESLDLEGRSVVPGLWDEHVHFGQQAFMRRQVDVSTAASALDAANAMGAALKAHPPKRHATLSGFGFRDGLWPDVPTATLLDGPTGVIPTVLVSADLHCCWLNSAALTRYGFGLSSTGLIREDEAFAVATALQEVSKQVLDGWIGEAAAEAAARGIVGVVDFEMADNIHAWGRRFANGFHSLRIDAALYTEHLSTAVAAGHFTGEPLEANGLLSVGPFKLLIDGSLNTRTAYCVDEYPGFDDAANSRGILTVSSDHLVRLMRIAAGAKIVPAIHAIGDEANRIALDAFETVGCGGRIEHAQLLRDADRARFTALGVAASVQPEQAMDDRDVTDRFWPGRTHRAFLLRSLLDAGATLLLGSDAPVAPLDPWVTMAAAVSRARDGREPWHPEQAISFEEALRASTRSTIAEGQRADIVVVDADPSAATPEQLRTMPVSATMLAGNFTHQAFGC